jgi:phosphoglycolate phosphatase
MAIYDGLIFDLDGTLWDASGSCTKAWNESFRQLGHDSASFDQATIRAFSGMRIETIFRQHFQFIPTEKHDKLLAVYKQNEARFLKENGGILYPQVKQVLAELRKRYPLFIVSNCLAGYIENFLAFHELQDLFTDFESSGNSGLPKSDNIRLIVERNGLVSPLYIGDTQWDKEAAAKASVPFVYAAYGFGTVDTAAQTIDRFPELKTLLL